MFKFETMKRYIFIILFLLTTSILSAQEISIPVLERQVTDLTNTLDFNDIGSLEKILQEFEDSIGSQIVILIVPTTGSEAIEDYSSTDEYRELRKEFEK